jgi:hypothetical protein
VSFCKKISKTTKEQLMRASCLVLRAEFANLLCLREKGLGALFAIRIASQAVDWDGGHILSKKVAQLTRGSDKN